MNRPPLIGGAMLDEDERKLGRLEELIREAREAERVEAARKAEEERQRREREAAGSGYTVADLEAKADELRAQIAARQHHLREQSEQEVLQRRAESLLGEIEISETRLAALREQCLAALARLESSS